MTGPTTYHNKFDLVHQRLGLAGAAGGAGDKAIARVIEQVKPGGYVQLVEAEMTIDEDDGPAAKDFLAVMKGVF